MSRDIVAVAPNQTLAEAAETMTRLGVSALLVTEAGEPVGIVTERDILRAMGADTDLCEPVAGVMSRPVATVPADADSREAYHQLVRRGIRHLLVVDGRQAPVGMVSESDFRKDRGLEDFIRPRDVAGAMAKRVTRLGESATVAEAAALMEKEGCGYVVVVDDGDRPLGIVTERDMVRLYHGKAGRRLLAQAMSKPVAVIDPDAPLQEAVERMRQRRLRRLVVTDAAGVVAGVLTEHDLVRHLEHEYVDLLRDTVQAQARELREFHRMLGRREKLDEILAAASDLALVASRRNGRIIYANEHAQELLGKATALPGAFLPETLAAAGFEADWVREAWCVLRERGKWSGEAGLASLADQRYFDIHASLLSTGGAKPFGYVLTLRDITSQRLAVSALQASETRYRTLVEHLPMRVFVKDRRFAYVSCNSKYAGDVAIAPADIVGKTDFEFFPAELAERYQNDDRRVMTEGLTLTVEEPFVDRQGRRLWIHTSKVPLRDDAGAIQGVVGIFADITERKRAEEELRRVNWALRALSRSNSALIHAESEENQFQTCCETVTSDGFYPLAWIGWALDDAEKTVQVRAAAGPARDYLQGLRVSWGDNALGRGPTGTVIRSGVTYVNNDLAGNPAFAPWREKARRAGLAASIVLPIKIGGATLGALNIYAREPDAFGAAEVALMEELAADLGFGVQTRGVEEAFKAAQAQREKQAEKLRDALESIIGAVGATLERRDPYTAGHERRVSDLAATLAGHLGLESERVHGLRLAGTVHDIGKVQVPAEILSRPVRLNDMEMALVRTHAETGYEILKDIDFPWPIAEIVRQHHEYLDGSGYPHGRKGDEILLEARILTVADIVEAMSSHRPYRPGLGLDAALGQIQSMRGGQLDPCVVDACVELFRRRDYRFPE
ncbi:hypothetical protein MoryE10_28290 [Methylogaea oryzae]|uniref:PAS domain S-box protein n=3 Tax=Methylogaea oryzae TaxID=1295382 RepID=A0A8D5AI72_9GAMM|nr:hypothetical protein MoryE10_28290 [Methylogaea oryzae]